MPINININNLFLFVFKMSLLSYFFGILTVFIIIIPFWFVSTINRNVNAVYRNTFCYGVCGYDGTGGLGFS